MQVFFVGTRDHRENPWSLICQQDDIAVISSHESRNAAIDYARAELFDLSERELQFWSWRCADYNLAEIRKLLDIWRDHGFFWTVAPTEFIGDGKRFALDYRRSEDVSNIA